MRIGLCGSMVVDNPELGGIEAASRLAELGYDYIELSLTHLAGLNSADFNKVKRSLHIAGIPCEACNNFFPKTIRLTGSERNDSIIKQYVEKALGRAAEIGAEVIVFGSGPAKNIPADFPYELAWQQLIDTCRLIDPISGRNSIQIAIEPLRKEECNIINTFAEGVRLVNEAETKNIRVLVDYFHLTSENESPENLILYRDYLAHVHFARFKGRRFPVSPDEENGYKTFFGALKKAAYNRRISIEAFTDNFYQDAKKGIDFFSRLKYEN